MSRIFSLFAKLKLINIGATSSENLINSVISGLFSVSIIIITCYAIVGSYLNKKIGLYPVYKMKRYNYYLTTLPLISILVIYLLMIYTNYNLYVFTLFLIIFISFETVYTYIFILPILNPVKFKKRYIKFIETNLKKECKNKDFIIQNVNVFYEELILTSDNDDLFLNKNELRIVLSVLELLIDENLPEEQSIKFLALINFTAYSNIEILEKISKLDIKGFHKILYLSDLYIKLENKNNRLLSEQILKAIYNIVLLDNSILDNRHAILLIQKIISIMLSNNQDGIEHFFRNYTAKNSVRLSSYIIEQIEKSYPTILVNNDYIRKLHDYIGGIKDSEIESSTFVKLSLMLYQKRDQ